jgi:hypothetical protein
LFVMVEEGEVLMLRRVFRFTSPVSPRRIVATLLMMALLTVLPMGRAVAHAQGNDNASDDPNAASPAGAHAEVIAQGVGTIPADQVAWRLVQDTAEPVGEAEFQERALGFAIAESDALLLTDESDGARVRLAPGEAAFVDDGTSQRRESLGSGNSAYWRIGLVAAGDAQDAGGDTLVYGGDAFAVPAGDRDLDLVAARLDAKQATTVASAFPVLVIVASGTATVSPVAGGQGTDLDRGEATAVDGSVKLTSSKNGTRILVAVVGVSVPAAGIEAGGTPAAGDDDASTQGGGDASGTGNGKIIVRSELCPPGVTADEASDDSAGDACFGGDPVVGMTVTAQNQETGETYFGEVSANGSAALDPLPAGSYAVSFETGDQYGETLGICGGQDQSADLPTEPFDGNSVELDLPADREYDCETRTLSLGDDTGGGSDEAVTGTVTATFYACPDGMTFETLDTSQCDVITDGFDFGFQGDVNVHLSDATPSGDGYVWSGLDSIYADNGDPVTWSHIVYSYPAGYDWIAYSYDGGPVMEPHAGGFTFTADQPEHTVDVYFIQH